MRRTPGVIGQTSSLQVETATSAQAVVRVELARNVVTGVDAGLLQRLENLRVGGAAGLAAGRARQMAIAGEPWKSRSAMSERPLLATQTKRTFTPAAIRKYPRPSRGPH